MKRPCAVLILGASYGSLLASKLLLAGHTVKLACLQSEADLINTSGIRIRLPIKGRLDPITISFGPRQGRISADLPGSIDPTGFDLVALAMQEPQYGAPGVRQLLNAVAAARIPCMSIMNMPPPPYLQRIPGIAMDAIADCYADLQPWAGFEPGTMTLCSPDPQAFRPTAEEPNLLQVALPTNFKVAPFESTAHTQMLRELQSDIEAIRYDVDGTSVALPVKLKVHDSLFVPLAKWCMLVAGNYRCVQEGGIRSIRDAVHGDLEQSRAIYDWVRELCRRLGASDADQVPFEKYAAAARQLVRPSSVARALAGGAVKVERVDRLVHRLAASRDMHSEAVDAIVALVDARLEANRGIAASTSSAAA
jgi:hypothetical protein